MLVIHHKVVSPANSKRLLDYRRVSEETHISKATNDKRIHTFDTRFPPPAVGYYGGRVFLPEA